MARPSLYQHPKFTRLAIRLRSRALAVGSLELVWQVGYESGNPYVGSPDEVEYVADWRGPAGELAAALLDCGFLDRREDGHLEIHDLHEHAPEYVRSRARMKRYRSKVRSGEIETYHTPEEKRAQPLRGGDVTVTQPLRNCYHSPTPPPPLPIGKVKVKVKTSSSCLVEEPAGGHEEPSAPRGGGFAVEEFVRLHGETHDFVVSMDKGGAVACGKLFTRMQKGRGLGEAEALYRRLLAWYFATNGFYRTKGHPPGLLATATLQNEFKAAMAAGKA